MDSSKFFPPSRLLYRFISKEELERVKKAGEPYKGKPDKILAAGETLIKQMKELTNNDDFGNLLHDFTMTPYGGGSIGSANQLLVATTSDVEKLRQSTDDGVQAIVRGADTIATFEIPKNAAINAPSDLSREEGEVIVPNLLSELGAMLIDYRKNPYKQ